MKRTSTSTKRPASRPIFQASVRKRRRPAIGSRGKSPAAWKAR